jgi:hypothetical protein
LSSVAWTRVFICIGIRRYDEALLIKKNQEAKKEKD